LRHLTEGHEPITLTVPGNLLLLGEYAVLEEGGLGITLALERRVVVTAELALSEASVGRDRRGGVVDDPARADEPLQRLEIEGSWGRDSVRWSDGDPGQSPLFGQIVAVCRRHLDGLRARSSEETEGRSGPAPREPAARLRVDSRAFFLSPERKGGFGSSAAVTVGLVAGILGLAGLTPERVLEALPRLALEAHRAAQGGGSGYDVYTSTYGGIGLFTGGEEPRWEPRFLPWLPSLWLVRGPRSVSSARAVERYRSWKRGYPRDAEGFLERSNETVRDFADARSWAEAERALLRGREEGIRLGERIGVPAALELPPALTDLPGKALGAGDELGVIAVPAGGGSVELVDSRELIEPLIPALEGVRWQW
jgi:phosphomevalonate kinase